MADIGKVYPSEMHLLKKEIEVQGEILDRLRSEVDAIKKAFAETDPEFLRKIEAYSEQPPMSESA